MSSSAQEIVRVTELARKQQTALAALRGGSGFPDAAQAAGVSRATVYRWVRSDPQFRAAYNEWQQAQAESARARLLGLADKAVDVVEKALGRLDQHVAVRMLKDLGALRRPGRGATDPEAVARASRPCLMNSRGVQARMAGQITDQRPRAVLVPSVSSVASVGRGFSFHGRDARATEADETTRETARGASHGPAEAPDAQVQ
jgi:AcrR family transcriptional regulator